MPNRSSKDFYVTSDVQAAENECILLIICAVTGGWMHFGRRTRQGSADQRNGSPDTFTGLTSFETCALCKPSTCHLDLPFKSRSNFYQFSQIQAEAEQWKQVQEVLKHVSKEMVVLQNACLSWEKRALSAETHAASWQKEVSCPAPSVNLQT